jgi:hypothetical protein
MKYREGANYLLTENLKFYMDGKQNCIFERINRSSNIIFFRHYFDEPLWKCQQISYTAMN